MQCMYVLRAGDVQCPNEAVWDSAEDPDNPDEWDIALCEEHHDDALLAINHLEMRLADDVEQWLADESQ